MKNIFKSIVAIFIMFGFLNAQTIEQTGEKNGYDVKLSSTKALSVGTNEFIIELAKDSKIVDDAKVKIKFFMPEMPGMPYMEYEDEATLVNGKYKVNINFSMGGTWQYHLKFKAQDGVVHTIRGSVNL